MEKLYKRIPGSRGGRVIQMPMAFTLKDVRAKNWPEVRLQMMENVIDLFNDALDQVEQEVR